MQRATITLALIVVGVSGHGWMTLPVSKNEMAFHHYQWGMGERTDFKYEPQSSNLGNGLGNMAQGEGFSCGANNVSYTEGLSLWHQWYDAAGVPIPEIQPGQELPVKVTLTIDHGGQSWLMLACADKVTEGANWTILERSDSDRKAHFMPSAPGAFAWAPMEYGTHGNKMEMTYKVPEDFSCPAGYGVARWVWKTAVSCNDFNNIGRSTEKFDPKDMKAVQDAYKPGWVDQACPMNRPPETFISCMDFVIGNHSFPTPPPAPPTPTPPPGPCGAIYAQCGGDHPHFGGPTCCQGGCTCEGTDSYKQCKPPKGQWQCGTAPPTPPPSPPAPPAPPAPPTPTPPPAPPAPPTPPEADKVSACHDAAKAYCTTKGGFCRACQAYGTWGDMFFVAVCNDDPTVCHQDILTPGGVNCSCQQAGGCKADGVTCTGNSTNTN